MAFLPDEIWEQIFIVFEDHMPSENWWMYGAQIKHEGLKTLRSIALVSRQFERVAQRLLYRTLLVEGRDYYGLAQARLLRTLSEQPQLGQHARDVSIDDDAGYHYRMGRKLSDTPLRSILGTGLGSLKGRFEPMRSRRRKVSDTYGFGALAASYMPHLQLIDCTVHDNHTLLPPMLSGRLGLEVEFLGEPEGQRKAFEDDYGDEEQTNDKDAPNSMGGMYTNYSFPNLTEVRVKTGGCDGATTVFVIEPILLHPTLKRLRTLGINWTGDESSLLKWPDRHSNLQYLDLKECVIDATGLRSVLTRCPDLKSLLIEMADFRREEDREEGSWKVDLSDFGNVLRQLARVLEDFDIHTLDYKSSNYAEGRIGSLKTLNSLKHLKTDKEDFLGYPSDPDEEVATPALRFGEALPPSLETLYLHWGDDYYDEDWREYKRRGVNKEIHSFIVESELYNLREIRVERYYNETMEGEWDSELKLDGWDISVKNEHLWKRYGNSGCMRTVLVLSKRLPTLVH
ncbi:hypothetical protein FSARC_11244 [Fusarium sarcochroum]|uniref:F-box domain-containing protein n=1 Tax=Fusarium sarcochroum TaxID=1208366 RepID=A0A8H4X1A3_9HYPO|nr:hypothetical protein FSARC_11244 [Fusarium sarcochroum]